MIISCVCVHNVSSLMFQQGWLITSCVSCLWHDREAHPSSPCHLRQVELEECRWTSPSNQNDWFPRTGTRRPRGISAADVELKTGQSLSLVPWWGGSCRWSASGRTWPPPTAAQPSPEPGTTCPVSGGGQRGGRASGLLQAELTWLVPRCQQPPHCPTSEGVMWRPYQVKPGK